MALMIAGTIPIYGLLVIAKVAKDASPLAVLFDTQHRIAETTRVNSAAAFYETKPILSPA